MQAGAPNLLVFREDRRRVRGVDLKRGLMREVGSLSSACSLDNVVAGLLRAGELECAVADAGSVPLAPYMKATDCLAESVVDRESAARALTFDPDVVRNVLSSVAVPNEVETARPEGFAYYGLHPLAYAEAVAKIQAFPQSVLVIGIRSIGTTLSAVTAAALRFRGVKAARITVRPIGHPYNRETQLSPAERETARLHLADDGRFIVVDEGPGLSGSSFLSVAEALVGAGVPATGVILLCAHEPEFDSLCAAYGSRRAKKFRWLAVSPQPRRPAGADVFVGGGEWRRLVFRDRSLWPASWTSFERLKYLSSARDGSPRLFKFAGLGHYGEQVLQREEQVALAGFGPAPHRDTEGFASYQWVDGRPMSAADLSPEIIARLASYCVFRAVAFAEEWPGLSGLEHMAQHNMRQLGLAETVCLKLERPVLADGRMQPHEWVLAPNGEMMKIDSGSHGDDHFFPGATDIAWDLAGAIVEWRMGAAASEAFLECYRRASGDNAASRITDFIAAYAVFRCAYCTMSDKALRGSKEHARLERAARQYSAVFRDRYLASARL